MRDDSIEKLMIGAAARMMHAREALEPISDFQDPGSCCDRFDRAHARLKRALADANMDFSRIAYDAKRKAEQEQNDV